MLRYPSLRAPLDILFLVCCIALTADVLESGRDACLDAGMDGFLAKPVDPALLEEMLAMLFPSEEPSHIVAA